MSDIKKGNYSSWQEEYKAKLCTAEDAAKTIQSNDRIGLGGGTCIPPAFSTAISKRAGEIKDVLISLGLAFGLYDFMKPENKESFTIETMFVGPMERICLDWKTAHYIPSHLLDVPAYGLSRKFTHLGTVASPPDENGYMCRSLFGSFFSKELIKRADKMVVEVNKNMPRINTEDFMIHVSEVDYIIENDTPIFELPNIPITETEEKIAAYIAEMIPNDSTIQIGIGGLANAVTHLLLDKKNLGIHTELAVPSIMELMKAGVVNGSKKNFMPNQAVAAFALGTKDFYKFIDGNKDFLFKDISFTNDPLIIGKNDNLISINNALMIDLTGQVASESIGIKQYSGTGGQVNFVNGAKYSKGGKSIIALNSTYVDKEGKIQSKVLSTLPQGTIVSTSRNDVEYIITEYGVANLRYKNMTDRIRTLINIAHPDFRDKLKNDAKRNNWL